MWRSPFSLGKAVGVHEQSAWPSMGHKHGGNECDQVWSLPLLTGKVLLVCDQSNLLPALLEEKPGPPHALCNSLGGTKGFWSNTE